MKEQAILQTIKDDRKILWGTDNEFLFEYQKAMLLALKELGILDEMQYQYAENKLKDQRRRFMKNKLSCHTTIAGDTNG